MSFAGAAAQTADLAALTLAKRSFSAGVTPERIWQDTGWAQGAEGGWRFEINDADARLRPEAHWVEQSRHAPGVPLARVLDHSHLLEAYPELATYIITVAEPSAITGTASLDRSASPRMTSRAVIPRRFCPRCFTNSNMPCKKSKTLLGAGYPT